MQVRKSGAWWLVLFGALVGGAVACDGLDEEVAVDEPVLATEEALTFSAHSRKWTESGPGAWETGTPLSATIRNRSGGRELDVTIGEHSETLRSDADGVLTDDNRSLFGLDVFRNLPRRGQRLRVGTTYGSAGPPSEYITESKHDINLLTHVDHVVSRIARRGAATMVRVKTRGRLQAYVKSRGVSGAPMKAIYVGVTDLLQVGGAWRVLRLTRLSESRADLEVASVDDVRSTPHSEFTACLDVSTVVSSDVVAAWQNDPLGVDEFRACGAKQ